MPGGDYQAMVNALVNDLFDGPFDGTKIEDHALLIEFACQHNINDPAFANQPALVIKIGEVNDCQVVDKKLVHERCDSLLGGDGL